MLRAIAIVAEQRIREAMDKGEFDNLPGRGRPLDLDGEANIPEELRMAWKLLKNAGYGAQESAPEPSGADAPTALAELLSGDPDEQRQVLRLRKSGVLFSRMGLDEGRLQRLESEPEYFSRIVSRIPVAHKEDR